MPYRDLGQSPSKTLGRPNGRVKASAYHPAYHRRQIPVEMPSACLETALLTSETAEIACEPQLHAEDGGVHDGLRQIAATGEYGPMRGVIGQVRL